MLTIWGILNQKWKHMEFQDTIIKDVFRFLSRSCAFAKEKKFCTGPTIEQPRQNKNLLYRRYMPLPNEPTKKDSFHLYTLSSHSPQFQRRAGRPLSSLSGKAVWLFKQAFTAWLQLRRSDERSPALTH